MDGIVVAFFVPVVVFLVVVAPIWIILHYKHKANVVGGLTATERAELNEMIEVADRMAARIETLEAILDVESPDWRTRQAQDSNGPDGTAQRENS